ncbi:MAG: V-type ATP synthase subunit I [Clostridium sp.]
MNKFTLLAFESQKHSLLKKLQAFANVEFSDLSEDNEKEFNELKRDNESNEITEIEGEITKVKFAIELLSNYSDKIGMLKSLKQGKKSLNYETIEGINEQWNWKEIYGRLKDKDNEIAKLKNAISKLSSNIEELTPWSNLDISISEANNLKSTVNLLGVLPQVFMDSLKVELQNNFKGYYFEVISDTSREANVFMVFHKDDEDEANQLLKKYSFSKINLNYEEIPRKVISEYTDEISRLKGTIESILNEMKSYVVYLDQFKITYEHYVNKLNRISTIQNFLKSENVVAMSGFYPSENHEGLMEVLKESLGNEYYIEFSEADGDGVPTLLKNNTFVSSFEPITAMYSTPRYKEIDPTPLFVPFYLVFFGMMLSDAGYGLLILLATGIALKAFNLDDEMRKTVRMFFYLSISTVIWGVLFGSYFGMVLIPPLWMTPDSDVSLLMLVSIAMGLIQIFVGLGIKGYILIRDGEPLSALWDVGLWYITLTGSILWAVDALGAGEAIGLSPVIVKVAGIATIIGMVFIVLTHGRGEKTIGAKLGTGIYSLYGITGYVGDLVSYTRLAALGLATGFIGAAFNIMVEMLGKSVFTIVFAGVVFAFGHIFNLLINALGAYVHTCRLQYLEYFGKFYEGGGKAFNPLKFNSQYYKILKTGNREE